MNSRQLGNKDRRFTFRAVDVELMVESDHAKGFSASTYVFPYESSFQQPATFIHISHTGPNNFLENFQ